MDKLKKGFIGLIKSEMMPIAVCEVLSVDPEMRTVDVRPISGDADILGVRLQARQSVTTGVCVLPIKGSHVLVGFLNKETACVLLGEQCDKLIIDDDVEIVINTGAEKISIQNQDTSLLTLIGDLLSLLETRYQVSTPAGPSAAVLPQTKQALTQLRNDFEKLLK